MNLKPSGVRIPGFVDIQINGGFGHDFTTDPASIWEVGRLLPSLGVTAFVPTVITSTSDKPLRALEILAAGPPPGWRGARPLGLHIEGPMISPDKHGTHPLDLLTYPDQTDVAAWIAAGPPLMVTLAPELPGASAAIQMLTEAGTVVSLGHSNATCEEAESAFAAGAAHATHLFNAMSGIDHRRPGLVVAVLNSDVVTAGLIADGVHIHPDIARLAYRSVGADRIALVTDAIAALGMGEGAFRIGDVDVTVSGVTVRNRDGALAGSAVSMPHLARTMAAATGCSLAEIVQMTSTTPSRIVGHEPPADDFTVVTDDFEVLATGVDGEIVFERNQP